MFFLGEGGVTRMTTDSGSPSDSIALSNVLLGRGRGDTDTTGDSRLGSDSIALYIVLFPLRSQDRDNTKKLQNMSTPREVKL